MSANELMSIVMVVLLLVGVMVGFPVAFALGALGIIFSLIAFGPAATFYQVALNTYGVMSGWTLLAIPLFVYMGVLLEKAGVAENLYDGLHVLLGGLKGGLTLTTMAIATFFAACTGIAGASVVAIGLIALPSMLKYKYDKALASGVICAGGGLGVIIPPSIMLIVYGPVAGLSVAKLFFASMLPGVVLSLIYIAYILITCYLDPSKGPSISPEERARWNRRDVIAMVVTSAFPPAALIFLVLGAIFFGVAAPTEAAALGSLGALFVIALYRRLTLRGVIEAGYSALKISTFIMFLVLGAKYFMTTFSKLGGGHVIYNFLMSVSTGKTMLLIIMLFIIFILGMFMDWIGILLVVVPIYVPIVKAMGWNPLWFAIMFCITLQISYITPPFAYSIFYLKGIAPPEVKLIDIYKGCVPFILLQFIGLVILYFWPDLCLYLPSMMK